jgi:UDP-N-acetyl-D-mannosaminuronic acid dehydrogenase
MITSLKSKINRRGNSVLVRKTPEGTTIALNDSKDKYINLLRKIKDKSAIIGVVGLGQVGLPTALSFTKSGFTVLGFDINKKLVWNLRKGKTQIPEERIRKLLLRGIQKNTFRLSAASDILEDSDVIVICVPTPLSESSSVSLKNLHNALKDVAKYLIVSNKLVIIESSIPPLTMDTMVIPTLETLSNKNTPSDFLISFCPERVAPGRAISEINSNPRIIGVRDNQSYLASSSLYLSITKSRVIATDFVTAETSKLAENSFRDVNIAFANELAIICQNSGVDVLDVIKIANTHPRVNIHQPSSGVGGPCLPKDPYLLVEKIGPRLSLIRTARSINDSMPIYLVQLLCDKLSALHRQVNTLRIGILGVAYKAGVNDSQYSPTQAIISELKKLGFNNIKVHDPYCHDSWGAKFEPELNTLLHGSDCIIISTPHSQYASLKSSSFKNNCVIFDPVRVLSVNKSYEERGIFYMAPGINGGAKLSNPIYFSGPPTVR